MKIIIGSDHGGYKLKSALLEYLPALGFEIEDVGCFSEESCDYPEFALKVARKVASSKDKGIIICGTGIGVCIVANKVRGIRAAACSTEFSARMSREHNDANILCLGERVTDEKTAKKIAQVWLSTEFSNGERHIRRIRQIAEIERC